MNIGETVLFGAAHPGTVPRILSTEAGWYVGYVDSDGAPYTRETVYFDSYEEAREWWAKVRR